MTIKLAINGFGRIGRNVLRAIVESGDNRHVMIGTSPLAANAEVKNETSVLDQILTGGIKPIEEMAASASTEEVTTAPTQERSVLAIIRENSDIQPSVSSGTDRVSVTVKGGDTLFSIARKHGLKVTELAGMNGLQEPYVIKIGQTL